MGTIIGIDLGTSTSEAAIIRDGKPEMILNFSGQVITPSAVGIDADQQIMFGEKAKAQYLLAPKDTVIEVKRKIGTKEMIHMGGKAYNPTEISAMLLSHVREFVSEYLKEDITRAVISVPAYFDDLQRQETVEAGKLAGFTVERIINEPTAAALSYGIGHMEEESHILVYDLGGGTFDVTLLEMFGGVLEVKASSGDNKLGGKDFDECLIRWMVRQFCNKEGIDLEKDMAAMVKLKEQAELCKRELSARDSYRVVIPFIAKKDGEPAALAQESWLISVRGKLLEQAPENSTAIAVTGLTAIAPQAGEMMKVPEGEATRLEALTALLGAMEDADLFREISRIQLEATRLIVRYADRFDVKMKLNADFGYNIRLMRAVREQMEEKYGPEAAGTIDLTQEKHEAVYSPAKPEG